MATPSSSGASYDSEVQSHFMHIFQLNQPVVQKRICTDTWAQMHSNIRHELGLSRHDVQHIHSVHHTRSASSQLSIKLMKQAPIDMQKLFEERSHVDLSWKSSAFKHSAGRRETNASLDSTNNSWV
jgi:hypothetical protein